VGVEAAAAAAAQLAAAPAEAAEAAAPVARPCQPQVTERLVELVQVPLQMLTLCNFGAVRAHPLADVPVDQQQHGLLLLVPKPTSTRQALCPALKDRGS